MKTISQLIKLLFLGLSFAGVASAQVAVTECPTSEGFAKLTSFDNIFFGEIHGTVEVPRLVRCVIEQKLKSTGKKKLAVWLELPDMKSADGKAHWTRHKDGRTSKAMWNLITWLNDLEKSGQLSLHFIPNDAVRIAIENGQSAFEKAMADNVKQILQDRTVIALAGAFHSQKVGVTGVPGVTPMGAYFGDSFTHVFLGEGMGGEAWACKGSTLTDESCRAHEISPMRNLPKNAKQDDLIDGAAYKHDYAYLLGKITASPPQNP